MNEAVLESPIFVIGMPRSGTTILFEALARHPRLGWVSNYCRLYPRAPWANGLRWLLDNRIVHLYGHKKQRGSAPWYNAWLPQPDEAYEFWDWYSGVRFSRAALHGEKCPAAAREALRAATARVTVWQRRQRFAAKLTGPPRIDYLASVFPNACFLHMIRDGRAVSHSLLNVPFWRRNGGFDQPFWSGLLRANEIEVWDRAARDPAVLAGVQWKRVIELARVESGRLDTGRYVEVRYEEFTEAPHVVVAELLRACGLSDHEAVHRYIDSGPELRNIGARHREGDTRESLDALTSSMEPLLGELGYD